jgi:hypothetical protein
VNWQDAAVRIRGRVGASIFERVAGPEGPAHHEVIFASGGERWFAEDRPIRRVHGDSSMFIGGISALLLQSLHPLAMAAVAGHSGGQRPIKPFPCLLAIIWTDLNPVPGKVCHLDDNRPGRPIVSTPALEERPPWGSQAREAPGHSSA